MEDEADESGKSIHSPREDLRRLAESASVRIPRSAIEGALASFVSSTALESVTSAARVPSSVIEEAQKSIAAIAQTQLRFADFVAPAALQMAELSATARLVDIAIPDGAVSFVFALRPWSTPRSYRSLTARYQYSSRSRSR